MQIICLNQYNPNDTKLYDDIFNLTKSLQKSYPHYDQWFYHTVLGGLKQNERQFLIVMDNNQIIACAILKHTPDEKKISTLFIDQNYRNHGLGQTLIQKAIQILGKNILMTISQRSPESLYHILNKFNFKLVDQKENVYQPDSVELYYYR